MTPLETSLARAGLEPTGTGLKLSAFGPHWLHDSPLLEDFTLAEADIVGAAMLGARATAGQVLVAEGEVGDWMLVVLSGTVDVTRRVGADLGETVRLAVIRAGATVGEMSMLDGEPRYASCTAIDAVEFAVLTRQAVARLIHEHPAVGAKLLVKITQLLAQRLRNTTQQLTRLLDSRTQQGRCRARREPGLVTNRSSERGRLIRGKPARGQNA
jgi:CRP/FNR family cyclic AMP-dependent transcriptional regulator